MRQKNIDTRRHYICFVVKLHYAIVIYGAERVKTISLPCTTNPNTGLLLLGREQHLGSTRWARQLKVARPQPRSPAPRTDPEGQFVYK